MKYLVVDNSKGLNQPLSYKEQYKLFLDKEKAVEYAKSIGYEDPFGMGVGDKIGVGSIYKGGDIDVLILPIEDDPNVVTRKDGTPVAMRG
jgi:hypothetical protein